MVTDSVPDPFDSIPEQKLRGFGMPPAEIGNILDPYEHSGPSPGRVRADDLFGPISDHHLFFACSM